MIKYLVLVLCLVGCSNAPVEMQQQVRCANGFETPWMYRAYISYDAPIIRWGDKTFSHNFYNYHIPEGVTCRAYNRPKNDLRN